MKVCCETVDILRACYETKMRFGTGAGAQEIPIRWFFSEGRPFLKGHTPYGSINWKAEGERPPNGPGEVVGAPRPFKNGNPPIPDCCEERELFHGGAGAGGSALFLLDTPLQAEGGGVGDGEAVVREAWAATGGGVGDGEATFGTSWPAIGGGLGDGAAYFETSGVGQGGGLGDGAAYFNLGQLPEGGGVGDGAAYFEASGFTLGGGVGDGAAYFEVWGLSLGGGLGDGAAVFGGGVPDVTEPGVICFYGNVTAPAGWLLCDGSAVNRTTYAALFAIIGTTFGVGDGSTTFNVPDIRGRVPLGTGSGSGLTTRTLANTGGQETYPLTSANLPAHTHPITTGGMNIMAGGTQIPNVNVTGAANFTGSAGTAVPTIPPFLVLTGIIKT